MELQPLVLINAVGLTPKLLSFAPRLTRVRGTGLAPVASRSGAGRYVHGTGDHSDRRAAAGARDRRQRLAVSRHAGDPVLATIQRAYSVGADLCDGEARGGQRAACGSGRPSSSGGSTRGPRSRSVSRPSRITEPTATRSSASPASPRGYASGSSASSAAFPFHTFWGPNAGLPCTQWIARCAAEILKQERPELSLVYLPHLDYDPQRFGPAGCDMGRLVRELDDACADILDAARQVGARVWVVSEYGHGDVSRPILLNRVLRRGGVSERPTRAVW